MCVLEKLIEVEREQFEHEAQVVSPRKMLLQFHNVEAILFVFAVQIHEDVDFNLCLVSKLNFVFDDLDCHTFVVIGVVCLNNNGKAPLAQNLLNNVSVLEFFANLHDIVSFFIIVSVVVKSCRVC